MEEIKISNSNIMFFTLLRRKIIAMLTMTIILLSAVAFANPYPTSLDNGNLVLVDGGIGVGKYADRSSVTVEQYAPPNYQIYISVVPVIFSEEYWKQHGTYIGSPYKVGKPFFTRFRYNWNRKSIAFEQNGNWYDWDINRDHSHADGEPFFPNTAEVAFVSAYNMRFFNDKTGYSPIIKQQRRVIDESLYRALGI